MLDYNKKYLKYKTKYLQLLNQSGGKATFITNGDFLEVKYDDKDDEDDEKYQKISASDILNNKNIKIYIIGKPRMTDLGKYLKNENEIYYFDTVSTTPYDSKKFTFYKKI